jgi:hypothetical protein
VWLKSVDLSTWTPTIEHVLAETWGALNSNFGTALVGAAAGALAGAWGAQAIVNRNERRKGQLSEVRAANTAIILIDSIVNSTVGLKRQYVLPMLNEIDETLKQLDEYRREVQARGRQAVGAFPFRSELRTIIPAYMSIEHLREILFNKLKVDRFTLGAYHFFAQALDNSRDILIQRNALIEDIRKRLRCSWGYQVRRGRLMTDTRASQEACGFKQTT